MLAPHPLLGATQRNEQGEEYASPPPRLLHSSQYIYDDDNYSDGGDGDSDDKMHWFDVTE